MQKTSKMLKILKRIKGKMTKVWPTIYGFPCNECLSCDADQCLAWQRSLKEVSIWAGMEVVLSCRYFKDHPQGRRMVCTDCSDGYDEVGSGHMYRNRKAITCITCRGKGWVWEEAYKE